MANRKIVETVETVETVVVPFGYDAYVNACRESLKTQIPFITITDTIYGIAVPYTTSGGMMNMIEKVCHIKQRTNTEQTTGTHKGNNKRIPLLVGSMEQLKGLGVVDNTTTETMDTYYRNRCNPHAGGAGGVAGGVAGVAGGGAGGASGVALPYTPTTLVVEQRTNTPLNIYANHEDTLGQNTLGIRLVAPNYDHYANTAVARELSRGITATVPIFATSANISGEPYVHDWKHILHLFNGMVGTLLYTEDRSNPTPSQVISLVGNNHGAQLR